jgi:hypothetical protein
MPPQHIVERDFAMTTSAADRVGARRSLLQLGGLLALLLLTMGLLALFAAWSLNRAHAANVVRVTTFVTAVDDARSAQAHFKTQVQEWKNLLLRGSDMAERARYLQSFAAEAKVVSDHLAAVERHLPLLGIAAVQAQALREEHAALGLRYAAAAQALGRDWQPAVADAAVRGIDRTLDRQIDALTDQVLAQSQRAIDQLRIEERRRYDSLQGALWTVMACSLALLAIMLWRVLRERGSGT